jgi:hypothetical protein
LSIKTFLESVGHIFKTAGIFVSSLFVKIFGDKAAHAFAVGAEAVLETALGQIAQTAVANADKLENSTQKFAAAGSEILAEAEKQGLSVTDSLKNMLIELAVQKLKASFGPATA